MSRQVFNAGPQTWTSYDSEWLTNLVCGWITQPPGPPTPEMILGRRAEHEIPLVEQFVADNPDAGVQESMDWLEVNAPEFYKYVAYGIRRHNKINRSKTITMYTVGAALVYIVMVVGSLFVGLAGIICYSVWTGELWQ